MAVTLKANFKIYNKETVNRLRKEKPDILPTYGGNTKKDLAYNKKQVTAAITSAVIQGKSIDKIADDLQTRMTTINQTGAIRTARTAVTSAQNGGTLASMKELAAMGVDVQKEWVATLDDRTRPSHRALDGQRKDLDDAFSNGLQYPGDSSGNAAEVWNCRCTMVSYIPEYDSNDEPRVTYSEWEDYKKATGTSSSKITYSEYKAASKHLASKNKKSVPKSFNSGKESNHWFYNQTEYSDWKNGLSQKNIKDIRNYTGMAYLDLNNVLRTYKINRYSQSKIESQHLYAYRMDDALADYDLPESITLLRGMYEGQLSYMLGVGGNTADISDPSSLIGKILGDEGFGSYTTALQGAGAITTSKPVALYVTTKTGMGVGAYINELSQFKDDEYEFLMVRNVKFKVTEAQNDNGCLVVKAEMI